MNRKRISKTLTDVYERKNELVKKIIRNPFVPILFIGELIKVFAITFGETGSLVTPKITILFVLAVISTVVWVFAEHILDEAVETYREIDEVPENQK